MLDGRDLVFSRAELRGSDEADPQVAVAYIGLESRGGGSVQHLQFSRVLSDQTTDVVALVQSFSTVDVYLDAASYLPVAIDFNVHPDGDAGLSLPVEIQFTNYQPTSGIVAPLQVQKYLNGGLVLDLTVASVTVNSGIPQGEFAVQ